MKDKNNLRNTMLHLLAYATQLYFKEEGEVLLGTGQCTEDGFFYDFQLPRSLKNEDVISIEHILKKIIKKNYSLDIHQEQGLSLLEKFSNQPFKLELLNDVLSKNENALLKILVINDFKDLCHSDDINFEKNTEKDNFKLLSFSSVYWKGDNQRETLTRIYGTAFENKEQLDDYLWKKEEAEKRDHRKLGKQLGLFHFEDTSPGAPYWLPNGLIVFHALLAFCRKINKKNHYSEISSPLINKKSLWETSGHWDYYREDMYLITTHEDHECQPPKEIEMALKPMNCPNAMVVFNIKRRSYRDLPLRLSDCDMLHRNEASGALHGLLRVRQFHQDDAHIFLSEEQIENECQTLLKMCQSFYTQFDMEYTFRLSTRPASFIGKKEVWDKAENTLIHILNKEVGEGKYIIAPEEGAFYGPKIDILMRDSLKRTWQMGTIQLDFQLPGRFSCQYVDEDGTFKTPVVIHRAIYGSLERFIGVLIEHTNGFLPVWLSPVQVTIIPITDRHVEFCLEKMQQLEAQDVRCTVDERSERMNMKIRDAEMMKIPYVLIIGDKEMSENTVACRDFVTKNTETLSFSDFSKKILEEIHGK